MKIAVVGSLTKDRIIIRSKNEDFHQVGGSVYYCSWVLAALGIEVFAFPILCKDDEGLLESLSHPLISVLPQWSNDTTTYENIYPEETLDVSERRLIRAAINFNLDEKHFKNLSLCDGIHLAPLSPHEFLPSLFAALRKSFSGTISIDGQGYTRGEIINPCETLNKSIDIIKLDEFEATAITSSKNETDASRKLLDCGIKEVVVTRASHGSTVYQEDQTHKIQAYRPDRLIDTTGCGDTYAASYLAKRLDGFSPIKSADFASGIASKKIEVRGALKQL